MCPSSGLWGGVLDCDSQFTILIHHRSMGPSFDALQACVPHSISSHVHIVPKVLPRSLCSWPCTSLHLLKEGHNHPIVRFAYLCHMIGEELVFCSFLYIKLFELGVEVALNNRPTTKLICSNPTPEQQLWAHRWIESGRLESRCYAPPPIVISLGSFSDKTRHPMTFRHPVCIACTNLWWSLLHTPRTHTPTAYTQVWFERYSLLYLEHHFSNLKIQSIF